MKIKFPDFPDFYLFLVFGFLFIFPDFPSPRKLPEILLPGAFSPEAVFGECLGFWATFEFMFGSPRGGPALPGNSPRQKINQKIKIIKD